MRASFVGPVLALLLGAAPALADVKFTRLDEDQFLIHDLKQDLVGVDAKAVTRLYEEVASICVAAGFEFFEMERETMGERRGDSSARVKFHHEDGDDLLGCSTLAIRGKVEKARKKLEKDAKKRGS